MREQRLGIEMLSTFGLPPVHLVELAADLGCVHISTGLTSFPYDPPYYPPFSLRDDIPLRREVLAAMRDRGVSISLGEGFTVRDGIDAREKADDLSIMAELGVARINAASVDPDLERSIDQFGTLAEMAAATGIETTVEISPGTTVCDLSTALSVIDAVARPDLRILIDTMHLVRSGSGAHDIAALRPESIGYIQISDAPMVPEIDNYLEESMFERMVPGTGEMPLVEILDALPRDLVIGLEMPIRSKIDAGVGPRELLGTALEAVRGMLTLIEDREPTTPEKAIHPQLIERRSAHDTYRNN